MDRSPRPPAGWSTSFRPIAQLLEGSSFKPRVASSVRNRQHAAVEGYQIGHGRRKRAGKGIEPNDRSRNAKKTPGACRIIQQVSPFAGAVALMEEPVMRSLILAAALLASHAAGAVESSTFQLRDTNDLVRACSVAPDHTLYANAMGFCHGVLVGAYGYYASTIAPESRFICPPNPVPTRSRVMSGFVAWAQSRPQFMKDAPIDTLFRYLAETYPCGK